MILKAGPWRAALLMATSFAAAPQRAHAYDMDCAVILCLAGGFPAGCGAAYSYMMGRITARPPKPPFGFCAMGSITDVDFPDNEDPDAFDAMLAEINEESVIATLQSVRVEIFRYRQICEIRSGVMERCTHVIALDGDGGNYSRGMRYDGWKRGERVTFINHEGNELAIGDAEAYIPVDQDCYWRGGETVCIDIYDWRPIATPAEEYNPLAD